MVPSCMLLQHSLLSFQIFQEVTNLALVSTVCKICLVYLVKWQCKAAILQSCVEQKQLVQLICPVTSCENCSFASYTPAQNQPAARVKGHWKKPLKNKHGSNLFWKLNLRELCHLFLVEKESFSGVTIPVFILLLFSWTVFSRKDWQVMHVPRTKLQGSLVKSVQIYNRFEG